LFERLRNLTEPTRNSIVTLFLFHVIEHRNLVSHAAARRGWGMRRKNSLDFAAEEREISPAAEEERNLA
jgi:hypothetical protein